MAGRGAAILTMWTAATVALGQPASADAVAPPPDDLGPIFLVFSRDVQRARADLVRALPQPRDPRRRPRDVTSVVTALEEGTGTLDFTQRWPPDWPEMVIHAWKVAHANCADRVGSPNSEQARADALESAAACRRRLALSLWTRFLQEEQPWRVLELSARPTASGAYDVQAELYSPADGAGFTVVVGGVPIGRLGDGMVMASKAALAGKGEPSQHRLNPALPRLANPEPSSMGGKLPKSSLPPVAIPCQRPLPATLTLTPESILSVTLANRWRTSVEAAQASGKPGQALSCDMKTFEDRDVASSGPDPLFLEVLLRCGEDQYRARTAADYEALGERFIDDVISERLLQVTFARLCLAPTAATAVP